MKEYLERGKVDVFISFYKSVSDPDNDIMDAMKKARLFVWELGKSGNKS